MSTILTRSPDSAIVVDKTIHDVTDNSLVDAGLALATNTTAVGLAYTSPLLSLGLALDGGFRFLIIIERYRPHLMRRRRLSHIVQVSAVVNNKVSTFK